MPGWQLLSPVDLNQKWFDPEWRAGYLDWYVAHSSLMADMLPVANTQLGPGSLAAILGGVFEGGGYDLDTSRSGLQRGYCF